jgi:transcription antitermination factor NusG
MGRKMRGGWKMDELSRPGFVMDAIDEINWFAVHTKRFREMVASASVAALGLEVFLPMVRVKPGECVIKTDSKPLFPGYFFSRFHPRTSLEVVDGARGVLKVLRAGASPMPVDEQAIREIQERVEPDGLICLRGNRLKAGDRVAVQAGPFAGLIGRVEREWDDNRRVAVLLEMLSSARVLVERCFVEAEGA